MAYDVFNWIVRPSSNKKQPSTPPSCVIRRMSMAVVVNALRILTRTSSGPSTVGRFNIPFYRRRNTKTQFIQLRGSLALVDLYFHDPTQIDTFKHVWGEKTRKHIKAFRRIFDNVGTASNKEILTKIWLVAFRFSNWSVYLVATATNMTHDHLCIFDT